MIRSNPCLLAAVALACVSAWAPQSTAFAQVPAASAPSGGAARAYSAAELETLVGPFALYPDDLVAIILPASTYPLQIVQADRFLDKRKANPKAQVDESWDDSVKALVNYPDVVKKMSVDLEWTEALGEAVVSSNDAVLEAVQVFRRKAQSAGNLKSNDKQTIVVEQQVIRVEPADPTIIYVPRYEASQVIVVGAPVYPYSPPYPVYHYPYPPGAALATGIIWGAALGAAWNGGRYATHYGGGSVNNSNNITINRGGNTINTGGNINRGAGAGTLPANAWKPAKQPGQVGGAGNRPASPRVGDPRPATGGGGVGGSGFSPRASQGDPGRGGGPSAGTRPAGGFEGRGQGGAFGGMDSGAAAHRASARGMESRGAAGGGGMQPARGGGGAGATQAAGGRPAGGGGAARAGGGGGGRAGGGGRGR